MNPSETASDLPTERMPPGYWLSRACCQLFFTIFYRYRVTGQENFPAEGPVILLSNHQSHLDPLVIAAAAPRRLRALARESLFFWPLSWIIRYLGAIPVGSTGSTRASLKATLAALEKGSAFLIFPEGTRTPDGEIKQLQPGFTMLTRKRKPIVQPMALEGSFQAWPRHKSFPGLGRIAVAFGKPIPPEEYQQWEAKEFEAIVAERLAECLVEARGLRD